MKSLLVFDLVGRMAHFRKFDTNSSSLSYSFPSRTTIAGMIAGILGLEKDSYYESFSPDQCKIAVSVRTKPRKIMQTINYMFVKSKSDLNNSKGHTQIPVEFLLSDRIDKNAYPPLRYRIYFWHTDERIHDEVKNRIKKSEYVYPPYLGLSEMLGQLEWVAEISPENMIERTVDEPIMIHSVCNVSDLEERSIQFTIGNRNESLVYQKERMARSFFSDRSIKETANYLYEHTGRICAKTIKPILNVHYNGIEENLLFM